MSRGLRTSFRNPETRNNLSVLCWKLGFGRHVYYSGTHMMDGSSEVSLRPVAEPHCLVYRCRQNGTETLGSYRIDGLGWDRLAELYRETQGGPETRYASRNIQEVVTEWRETAHGPLIPLNPEKSRRSMEVARVSELMQLLRGERTRITVFSSGSYREREVNRREVDNLVAGLLSG